jgi:enoyl-CoA hydratase
MIHREDRDAVTILRVEHGKANAVDVELFDALRQHLDQLEWSGQRAIVLTGTGGSFSAGVDLFRVLDGGADYLRRFLPVLTATVRRLFSYPRPVVAAVNGHAIAGGCVLACACDARVATSGPAKLGLTELLVGVPFPVAALEVVRFLVPDHVVQRMVYTGRLMAPAEALALGLVDELAEPERVLEAALERAAQLARIPGPAFSLTKKQLRASHLDQMAQAGINFDDEVTRIWCHEGTLATIRAFLEATVGKK